MIDFENDSFERDSDKHIVTERIISAHIIYANQFCDDDQQRLDHIKEVLRKLKGYSVYRGEHHISIHEEGSNKGIFLITDETQWN